MFTLSDAIEKLCCPYTENQPSRQNFKQIFDLVVEIKRYVGHLTDRLSMDSYYFYLIRWIELVLMCLYFCRMGINDCHFLWSFMALKKKTFWFFCRMGINDCDFLWPFMGLKKKTELILN